MSMRSLKKFEEKIGGHFAQFGCGDFRAPFIHCEYEIGRNLYFHTISLTSKLRVQGSGQYMSWPLDGLGPLGIVCRGAKVKVYPISRGDAGGRLLKGSEHLNAGD